MTVLATGFSTDYFISEEEYRGGAAGARAKEQEQQDTLQDVGRVWGGGKNKYPSGGTGERSDRPTEPRGFISRWLYRLFGRRT